MGRPCGWGWGGPGTRHRRRSGCSGSQWHLGSSPLRSLGSGRACSAGSVSAEVWGSHAHSLGPALWLTARLHAHQLQFHAAHCRLRALHHQLACQWLRDDAIGGAEVASDEELGQQGTLQSRDRARWCGGRPPPPTLLPGANGEAWGTNWLGSHALCGRSWLQGIEEGSFSPIRPTPPRWSPSGPKERL